MQTVIAKLMDLKGLKSKTLARKLEVTDAAFCGWKNGRVCVPQGRRKQLADALGVEVDDILDNRGLAKLAEEAACNEAQG